MYRYRTAEAWLGRRCEAGEQEWQLGCLYTGHILHRVRDKISLDRSLRGRRFSRMSIYPTFHRRSLRLQQKNTDYSTYVTREDSKFY